MCFSLGKFFVDLLGQWLNFKLFGITYSVGKIKFNLFFSGSRAAKLVFVHPKHQSSYFQIHP